MDPPFKRSSSEVTFRLLCPTGRTGAIIGKGGAVIRLLQTTTGAKIRVIDDIPIPCDERVVLIIAPIPKASGGKDAHAKRSDEGKEVAENPIGEQKQDQGSDSTEPSASREGDGEDAWSPGQKALVRVLERIVKGDDAACSTGGGDEADRRENGVCCRLLVGPGLMGCVLGRGGKTMEKIRQESGAIVRVAPKDYIPPCAFPGDELLQISGNLLVVKKALIAVSSCLQERARIDAANSGSSNPCGEMPPFPARGHAPGFHPADYHHRDYPPNPLPEDGRGYNRMGIEEEVVYKLLCQADKVGSLIGKGGSVVRAIQNETGASIKVADPANDSDERVVVISSREVPEQRHSPAQDAVIRVHNRIAEIGLELSATVVARLLVHSSHVSFLLGKAGHVITEMRKATGASIRVFQKEQSVKYGSPNDEIVQVSGNMQCVQDALFHITSRLREAILPMRPPFPSMTGPPPFYPPFQEVPPPYRPQHYPPSPVPFHSPVPPPPHDPQLPPFSHGMDRVGPPNLDQPPFPYVGERYGPGPAFDRPPSPRSWIPHGVSDGHHWGMAEPGCGGENQAAANSTVEVVIPQVYLTHICGENNSNLNHIKQISGASVVVHEPKAGATEGLVVVSGTSNQARFAQTLIHAFILCGQA